MREGGFFSKLFSHPRAPEGELPVESVSSYETTSGERIPRAVGGGDLGKRHAGAPGPEINPQAQQGGGRVLELRPKVVTEAKDHEGEGGGVEKRVSNG